MAEKISTKINRFYSLISNYKEGAPNTRYKSWEWCHKAFSESKDKYWKPTTSNKRKNEIIDLLSLHLAFYLASWGMLRNSFLLQRDYKTHKNAIKEILKKKYKVLWDYNPSSKNDIKNAEKLLFEQNDGNKGIYWKIKESYGNDKPTDTLVTKILMGTFGCIPAFDRYLRDGIVHKYGKKFRKYALTKYIENGESFGGLSLFAIKNQKKLKLKSTVIKYPIMKLVDMYFWEIGYELDLMKGLANGKNNVTKKKKLRQQAIDLKLCKRSDSFKEASKKIKKLN